MHRILLALTLLLSAAQAMAAGAFVTRTEQSPSGTILTQYYDMSGTGIGPFLKVYVCSDGNGNICPTGGGGGSGGAVYGSTSPGATPTGNGLKPFLDGFVGTDGTVHQVTPTDPLPTIDAPTEAGVGTPGDAAAAVGGNGSSVAQLKQAVTQLSTQVTRLNTIITTLGSPFQAGGSIGNTAFGISGTLPAYAAVPAFKIDQTTPGTTNAINLADQTTGTTARTLPASSDANSAAIYGLVAVTRAYGFNGTSWDRLKAVNGNANATVIPQTATSAFQAVSVTTSSTAPTALAAGTRKVLFFKNQSTTATVAVCPANINSGTAAQNTAGCIDLGPGASFNACNDAFCPSDAFNVIGSAAAALTVEVN